jgi:hypothetical protein
MALKTVLENTDGLDEAILAFYTEKDGKFILDIEGVDAHPDVANLKSAYERTKQDRETVRQERDQYKTLADSLPADFSPEKWEKVKEGKTDEAAKLALRQEYEAKIAELEGKVTATQQAARKTAIERDLTESLTAAGVTNPAFVKAARLSLEGSVQVGDDGKAFADTDMGPLGLTDFVKRWAASDGKDFVTAPQGGGSKAGDRTVVNKTGDLGGDKSARVAALKNRFPDLQ